MVAAALRVSLSVFARRCGRSLRPTPPQVHSTGAKKDYALIFGTVWGPDAHPVAGVPIRIRRASEKKAWELVSDRSGEFAQRVPVGTQDYVIQADIKTPKGHPSRRSRSTSTTTSGRMSAFI